MARQQPQQGNSLAQMQEQNDTMRAVLLNTAPRMVKNLGTQTAATSGVTRQRLFNVGVITKLLLQINADITIGTATATPSGKAPYNMISRVKVTDFDGTDRVNLSGFQLFILNCVRYQSFYGYNNEAATAVFVNPLVPTAVASATLRFFMEVPLAFDVDNSVLQLQDLRGAIMAQTNVGELTLVVEWTTSLYTNNDVESVYAGAGTTTVVGQSTNYITLQVWQEYIFPQSLGNNGAIPLPELDLRTVYELNGNFRSADNLVAASGKLINYPNLRSVIGAYFNYVSAGALSNAVTTLRLIANGNNILQDDTLLAHQFRQRLYLRGSDIASGVFFKSHRNKPIETMLYGNVQLEFTPSSVGATPYVEIGFESFYTKGAALPGMSQASG